MERLVRKQGLQCWSNIDFPEHFISVHASFCPWSSNHCWACQTKILRTQHYCTFMRKFQIQFSCFLNRNQTLKTSQIPNNTRTGNLKMYRHFLCPLAAGLVFSHSQQKPACRTHPLPHTITALGVTCRNATHPFMVLPWCNDWFRKQRFCLMVCGDPENLILWTEVYIPKGHMTRPWCPMWWWRWGHWEGGSLHGVLRLETCWD